MAGLKFKKGDMVKIIAGSFKGQTGKIVSVQPKDGSVKIEGINVIKRHVKPNVLQPQGGIVDKHVAIDASKVAILDGVKKGSTSKIGFIIKKDGSKARVYKTTNKEIDV